MLYLEQHLKELSTFVKRLSADKEKNIQEIQTQGKTFVKKFAKYQIL
jgi:hypothetical protein